AQLGAVGAIPAADTGAALAEDDGAVAGVPAAGEVGGLGIVDAGGLGGAAGGESGEGDAGHDQQAAHLAGDILDGVHLNSLSCLVSGSVRGFASNTQNILV